MKYTSYLMKCAFSTSDDKWSRINQLISTDYIKSLSEVHNHESMNSCLGTNKVENEDKVAGDLRGSFYETKHKFSRNIILRKKYCRK